MKKLLLISCAVGMSFIGYSQQSGLTTRDGETAKVASYADSKGDKADILDWYNYADEAFSIAGGDNFFTILFPDTTVLFEYGNGYGPPNFQSMGQSFDPKGAFWISKTEKIDSNDSYHIDSIAIPYRYYRYQTANADTLVIHVYKHDKLLDYTMTASGRGFKTCNYDYTTYRGTNFDQNITEILDENDTTSTAKYLQYEINIDVNPGEVLAVTWTYLPGNPYSTGDTLYSTIHTVGNQLNRFDQFYHSDPSQLYAPGSFNAALVVQGDNRYNTGTSWDGIFITGIAYPNYLNSQINFLVNATDVGIEDANEMGFAVDQNYPNPFSNITNIEYALTSPTNVNIEIFDITGKSVISINEGMKNFGEHKVSVDASSLKNGVYYYTFRTDAGQVTKKMMIQR